MVFLMHKHTHAHISIQMAIIMANDKKVPHRLFFAKTVLLLFTVREREKKEERHIPRIEIWLQKIIKNSLMAVLNV